MALSKIKNSLQFLLFSALLLTSLLSAQPTTVKHPEWSKNRTIYEVNVRQYTPQGTFRAFSKHLPRLKALGADILWFMPIHPIGEKNRKGSLGSYYAVKDYKAVNPEFGTLDDFKKLVRDVHAKGMYVIIDWVANHTSPDNVWTKEHPEYFTKDSLGNFIPPVADWSDCIDLNYDNRELWNAMAEAMKFWVKECDIDGFRCDVAGMVPLEFWNIVRPELDAIKPVFMLAEAHEPALQEKAFDMTYNWQLKDLMNEMAKGTKTVKDLEKYYTEKENAEYNKDAYRMNFTTNHDENSWSGSEYERLGDEAVEAFTALTFTLRGMPLIYSGQEAGLQKRLRFFDKDTIIWNKHKMKDVFTKLTALKHNNQALWNGISGGDVVTINTTGDENVYGFYREKNGKKVVALFNFSKKPQDVTLDDASLKGSYKNVMTKGTVTLNGKDSFKLKAWDYMVLEK